MAHFEKKSTRAVTALFQDAPTTNHTPLRLTYADIVLILVCVAEKILLWYIVSQFLGIQQLTQNKLIKSKMSILKIYQYPEPVLRHETQKITNFDENLTQLVNDMGETMYEAPGIGLAAPQVGKSVKLIVVDTSKDREGEQKFMAMVNPEIIAYEGKQLDEEGCLSVPELTANVNRYKKITVSYQDLEGKAHELTTEDRFAVVLQHEIDHLNGILFLDHLSSLKRSLYKKKVKKWLKE